MRSQPVRSDRRAIVGLCSEIKLDADGRKRPWIDRERDRLVALAGALSAARAVLLADKLHNLLSMELDLGEGRPIWALSTPNVITSSGTTAPRSTPAPSGDPRDEALAASCREVLDRIETRKGVSPTGTGVKTGPAVSSRPMTVPCSHPGECVLRIFAGIGDTAPCAGRRCFQVAAGDRVGSRPGFVGTPS